MRLEKLSLQEVGVTILLSKSREDKHNDANRKVISLKDMSEFYKHKPALFNDPFKTEQQDMEEQITNLEQEIITLQQKKDQLLQDIQVAIQKEKEAWLETKEKEREEAQNIGFKTGYDAGVEKAEQTYERLMTEANERTKLATDDYYKTIAKHEQAIIQLAMAAAEKVTKQHIDASDVGITEIVKQALKDLKDKSNISIYVHHTDYEFVMNRKEELEEILDEGQLLSIYIDDQMNQGDCIIKHPFGQVDIGIDVQLSQIKAALEEKILENQ